MAKKTTEYLQGQGQDITVEAIGATEGNKVIESAAFDLYLISPQTRMYFKQFADLGERVGRPVVQIPPQAYVPIPNRGRSLSQSCNGQSIKRVL